MNTPGHAVVSLALLGDRKDRSLDSAVLGGALLPDAPMVVFWLWAKLVAGLPERTVWGEAYFDPAWQAFFDVFNSVPLALAVLWVAHRRGMARTRAFAASMLLHFALDLPLHHTDAHRHFFPLSDFRFESPISYWDPAHYGSVVAWLEFGAVLALTLLVLLPRMRSWWWRCGVVAANLYYPAMAWVAARYWS